MDSFWIWHSSSIVSCKKISLLLPHQYPKFVLKLFNFTSTTNCPNLCEVSDTQKLSRTTFIRIKWYKLSGTTLITVIFLAARVYPPQSWCRRCEEEMSMSYHCELYLNFWSFLMCWGVFPFCWVWPNFAWTKYQWYCVGLFVGFVFLCNLSVGSSIFHYFVGVFLSLKWL